jgi:hypothetical protein
VIVSGPKKRIDSAVAPETFRGLPTWMLTPAWLADAEGAAVSAPAAGEARRTGGANATVAVTAAQAFLRIKGTPFLGHRGTRRTTYNYRKPSTLSRNFRKNAGSLPVHPDRS